MRAMLSAALAVLCLSAAPAYAAEACLAVDEVAKIAQDTAAKRGGTSEVIAQPAVLLALQNALFGEARPIPSLSAIVVVVSGQGAELAFIDGDGCFAAYLPLSAAEWAAVRGIKS